MKKILLIMLPLLLAFVFAACGVRREGFIESKKFMKDGEILDIPNPSGKITISYTLDGALKREEFLFVLYYKAAPITVTNFVNLAQAGHFNGLLFHRFANIDGNGCILQGGAFENVYDEYDAEKRVDLKERSPLDYAIKGEFKNNGWTANASLTHKNGAMAMARTPKADSAGSQFYLSIGDNAALDGDYAVFGQIIDNSALLTSDLNKLSTPAHKETVGKEITYRDVPKIDITIVSVTIDLEKGALGDTRGIAK